MPKPDFLIDLSLLNPDKPIADIEAIRQFNPQRHEMEQLSGIVWVDEEKHGMIGFKDVTDNDFWIQGHMPGFPIMPGVLMCEAAAQLASFSARRSGLLADGRYPRGTEVVLETGRPNAAPTRRTHSPPHTRSPMRTYPNRRRALPLACAALVTLAACDDDDLVEPTASATFEFTKENVSAAYAQPASGTFAVPAGAAGPGPLHPGGV